MNIEVIALEDKSRLKLRLRVGIFRQFNPPFQALEGNFKDKINTFGLFGFI